MLHLTCPNCRAPFRPTKNPTIPPSPMQCHNYGALLRLSVTPVGAVLMAMAIADGIVVLYLGMSAPSPPLPILLAALVFILGVTAGVARWGLALKPKT